MEKQITQAEAEAAAEALDVQLGDAVNHLDIDAQLDLAAFLQINTPEVEKLKKYVAQQK